MKKPLTLISKYAIALVLASSGCIAQQAAAQTTKVDEGPPKGTSSMAGVGAKPRKSEVAKPADPTMKDGMKGMEMSGNDKQFVTQATMGGMKEVHMGQMAQQQGQSAEVKKLGGQIVADHTKANNQLMAIASKRGVKMDPNPKMMEMSKKDMGMFDQAWLGMMMKDHDKDIALYNMEAKQGTDPELKAFATKTLPVLKKHLQMVKSVQSKMMKNG